MESTRPFSGRLLRLRVDRVRLPGGRVTVREVVEHPGAVGVVAVDPAGRVRLNRQHRHAAGETLLEIPAGLREPGEDAVACGRRELWEETGLRADRLDRLGGYYPSAGMSNEFIELFLASGVSAGDRARPEPEEEILGGEWLPLAQAVTMVHAGRFRDAKTMLGILLAARRLGVDSARKA